MGCIWDGRSVQAVETGTAGGSAPRVNHQANKSRASAGGEVSFSKLWREGTLMPCKDCKGTMIESFPLGREQKEALAAAW